MYHVRTKLIDVMSHRIRESVFSSELLLKKAHMHFIEGNRHVDKACYHRYIQALFKLE